MKILVTGGSGFIGSHVVDKLLNAGHFVRVFDLKEPHRKDVEYYKGNLTSREDVKVAIRDIEVVYHFAAASNIDLVKKNPIETIEFNIMGTAYFLEESRLNAIKRFILASSVFVHDTRGHLYTTSKLASELLCKNYNKLYDLPYTILRIGTAYGARSRNADVISIFVKKILNKEELIIHGTGEQKRNFIYVEDIASAAVSSLRKNAVNKTFVIAGSQQVSIKELALRVRELLKSDVNIRCDLQKGRDDDYLGVIENLQKTHTELYWSPRIDLDEGVKRYAEWYIKHMDPKEE